MSVRETERQTREGEMNREGDTVRGVSVRETERQRRGGEINREVETIRVSECQRERKSDKSRRDK